MYENMVGYNCTYGMFKGLIAASDTDEILTDVFNCRKGDAHLYSIGCPLASDWPENIEEMK